DLVLAPFVGTHGDSRVTADDLAPRITGTRFVRAPVLDERPPDCPLLAHDALAERDVLLLPLRESLRDGRDVLRLLRHQTDAARAEVQAMDRHGFCGAGKSPNPRQQ